MFRKTLGFIVTVLVVLWAGFQLAWHPEIQDELFSKPFQSLGLLVLVLLALVVLVKAMKNPNKFTVLLGVLLGIAIATVGWKVLKGIEWGSLLGFAGVVLMLVLLWIFTVKEDISRARQLVRIRRKKSSQDGEATAAAVS